MLSRQQPSDQASIARIELYRLHVPLKVPYRLAFGPQHGFDCVLVKVTDREGRSGWGEATLLPGYTEETAQSAFALASEIAPYLIGCAGDEAERRIAHLPAKLSFTACALRTALEQTAEHPILGTAGRARLLGAINEKPENRAALEAEIERLIGEGYTTLKMKAGFDLERDLAAVALVQEIVAGRAMLRIDANQGFTREEGVAFAAGVAPEGVELIEQPCQARDWEAAVAVKRAAKAPVMLDESIYGLADIQRAAELGCADFIKLKLMKMAGLDRLIEGLAMIRACGMQPVLGNGVATDLGCWMEAAVAAVHIDNAGEMNGFLRVVDGIMDPPLLAEGPEILLDGRRRVPDPDKLAAYKVAEAQFA
ncbi:mandelate racemase/muconate lactonizing enzyme family protein [Afifella pfennigii]|uniref:mandelate racemase/muconate lactonizing enzyme family protein n=1 Tax=Afifella pfennigii TaxID=209897 RepID=UPI00068C7703|nr:enolase C-terminal domain-like protein [Afifella pfennigii]